MSKSLKRAVAYARFSSSNQREESLDAQNRAINDFAAREGYTIVQYYADSARSATTDNRPEFQKMIHEAPMLNVEAVIVHKLDRFSRDRYDSAVYKHSLKKVGIKVISVLENFNDSPESVILESLLEGMAEYYSRNLARETMKGLKENAYNGRHNGGKPPLGYDVNPVTHQYIINENEAVIVRSIFDMYLAGKSYEEIVDYMNTHNCRTKSGNPYSRSSIRDILHNEKYTGVYIFNLRASKSADGKYNSRKHKSGEDIVRIEGMVPSIIDRETFDKVQAIFEKRKHTSGAFSAKRSYLLSSKIICGECGSRYIGNYQKATDRFPEYISYRCSRKNKSIHCENKAVRCSDIESRILKLLADKIFEESLFDDIATHYTEYATGRNEELVKLKALCENSISGLNAKIGNIVNIMANTGSAALAEQLATLENDRERCRSELTEVNMKLAENGVIDKDELREAFEQAKKMLIEGSLENRRLIIDSYVDSIVIYKDRIDVNINIDKDFSITESIDT